MTMLQPARIRPRDRAPTESDKAVIAAPVAFPAPIAGLQELLIKTDDESRSASYMENMFPTVTGARVRGGCKKAAMVPARVRSLFTYTSGTTAKLFASTGTAIYDVSALNPAASPSAAVSGLTSGYLSTEQMGTVGGEYLYAVNGTDSARLYDGATWVTITGVSTPAITGVTTSALSYVWKHKSRLWFVEKNTKRAWYLPVDSIGGAAGSFSLAGVFQSGGSLLFGTTWTQDAGDGSDDRIVFVSTQGEVAVYQGANPADAATWGLVGLYKMPPPRGMNAFTKVGGDVLIATDEGLLPLSAVTQKDVAELETSAVSNAIRKSWRRQATRWDGVQPWEIVKWPRENMMLVSLPHELATCFVVNMQSGAWSRYVGWDVQCLELHVGQVYFGDRLGNIFAAEAGGTDNGVAYVWRVAYTPTSLGVPAAFKTAGAMRATFRAVGTPIVQLSVVAKYDPDFPGAPPPTLTTNVAALGWDAALWDVALWDDDGVADLDAPTFTTGWVSVAAQGTVVGPQLQGVISGEVRPNIELLQVDLVVEVGGSVVGGG